LTNAQIGTQIKEALDELPGVDTTNVCLRTGSITVQYSEATITPPQMLETILQQGFSGLIWPACCLLPPQ
jgi:copper chaperone CopZ